MHYSRTLTADACQHAALDLALADWVQSAHVPLADAGEEISMHLLFSSLNWPVDNRLCQASRLQINSNQEVGIEYMNLISSYTQGQGTLAGYGNLLGVEVFPYIGYPTSVAADASTGRTFVEGKAFAGWLKLKAALLWGTFFMCALLHREPSWRRLTGLSH
ncbi:unnamed protein product [Sphagnum jensenii]|uniref:Uncharacterized protein n=1 Tax=Sphagnum jensenii TaxID=128206 RepID=A0ABP1BA20_9BRYO